MATPEGQRPPLSEDELMGIAEQRVVLDKLSQKKEKLAVQSRARQEQSQAKDTPSMEHARIVAAANQKREEDKAQRLASRSTQEPLLSVIPSEKVTNRAAIDPQETQDRIQEREEKRKREEERKAIKHSVATSYAIAVKNDPEIKKQMGDDPDLAAQKRAERTTLLQKITTEYRQAFRPEQQIEKDVASARRILPRIPFIKK